MWEDVKFRMYNKCGDDNAVMSSVVALRSDSIVTNEVHSSCVATA